MQHPQKKKVLRKSRRWLLTALLLTALAVSAAFVMVVPQIIRSHPAHVPDIPESGFRSIRTTPAEQIASVTIMPPGEESYTLIMHGGTLMLETPKGLTDINDRYAADVLEAVTQIAAQMMVAENADDVEEHLGEMGLRPPRASALIRYADGSEEMLEVGAEVPNTTYSYCRFSGHPSVYMCDVGVTEALCLTVRRLIPVEQPAVYASLLDEAVIRNENGEWVLSLAEDMMISPVHYPLSEDGASAVETALANFRLGTLEGNVTEENRAAYGFDNPVCVMDLSMAAGTSTVIDENGGLVTKNIEAQELRFVIGREEGEFFYTCEYEGSCYLVSRFLVQTLVELQAERLLSRTPADWGETALSSVVIEANGARVQMEISYQERVMANNELETDEAGNPVYDALVRLNGSEGNEDQLSEMLSRLAGFTAAGNVPAGWTKPDEKPLWSIELTAVGGWVRRIEGYALDRFSDVMAVDGTAVHTVSADAVSLLMEGFF